MLDTGIAEVPEIRGRVKASYALDRTTNRWTTVQTHDTHGHGTHVAGYHDGMRSAVQAVMQTGNRIASFSGGGTMTVNHQSYEIPDLVAPSDGVTSTSCVMGGWYESWGGTSMATPLVSGLAALIIERHPTITVVDLQAELLHVR